MSKQMGIRFHPTDTELINYLKRFFKGELSLNQQCPIQFVDIYGDQSPWEIFGANSEEKFRYFITPLKKRKIKDKRFCRTCAKGTWKGQTGEDLIKRNHMGLVVGFKKNFKFETNFVVCRIKKKITMDKEKNVDHVMDEEDGDVAGVIDPMLLLEPNHNNDYSTTEDEVRVCEATTSEYDVSTMEKKETTLEVEEGHGVDDIRSEEDMYRTFEDIPVDIPDDWLQHSSVLQDI
uniref:NAC transcription factor n=1 Tax=Solanum tuberosum TaxID=4113 RepID=M1DFS4_SOLTU